MDFRRECEVTIQFEHININFNMMVDKFGGKFESIHSFFDRTKLAEKIQYRWPEEIQFIRIILYHDHETIYGKGISESFYCRDNDIMVKKRLIALFAKVYSYVKKEWDDDGEED